MALKSAALVYRLFTATPLSTETERSQAILPQVTKSYMTHAGRAELIELATGKKRKERL
ncbi:MAG: hypothetical protein VYC98_06015 [Planctomycetota bacterium]|nr:hypothetical protein [Planctomycetota bacterium]